jgi:hypothetical protein
MSRLLLALAAILLLTLSAGFTHTGLRQMPLGPDRFANVPLLKSGLSTTNADAAFGQIQSLGPGPTVRATPDDAPAPALLIYLGLIVVGSAAAVGLVRYHQRREI